MNNHPSDKLSAVVAESRLWLAGRWIAEIGGAAWDTSRVARETRASVTRVRSWPPADRVRFCALVLTWAGLWHMVGLWLLPRYVTSGLPLPWFAAGTFVAAAVAVFAEPVARAWSDSATRRRVLKGSEGF